MIFVITLGRYQQCCVKFTVDTKSSGASAANLFKQRIFRVLDAVSIEDIVS